MTKLEPPDARQSTVRDLLRCCHAFERMQFSYEGRFLGVSFIVRYMSVSSAPGRIAFTRAEFGPNRSQCLGQPGQA
jgi:hypothetical protein